MSKTTAPIVRVTDVPVRDPDPSVWIGRCDIFRVSHALGTEQLRFLLLRMDAGARTRRHLHSVDQLIYQIDGAGIVVLDGGEEQRVESGECVLLPANVFHVHGAANDGPAFAVTTLRGDYDSTFEDPPTV